ncbi:hypothetical protein H0H81_003630 [Sphagnurus paluster]|uniref:FAD/NAD(P)-binding domain-containing protein n=1 Tax=Sphagnurus paluster TaxID=117069 RepID=A0A9P7KLJ7_9AGAR|nr:hypothetical protein H0H81_003630 [Sphagnurus paluster]
MAFSSYSFPPSTSLFPHANVVQRYLESYAEHFRLLAHIHLNTTVTSVTRQSSNWNVTLSNGQIFPFDLVIICNGHYRIPRYPDTPGIAHWLSSGRALHSAWYRHPHNLGDTVLVVGAGPSGQDISSEMCTAARTVIHSVSGATNEDIGNLKKRGRVSRFYEDGRVMFADGTIEADINHCILATGYEVAFPFLSPDIVRASAPPVVPPLPCELYNSTYSVFPLAKHIFPLQSAFPPESIAFLGLLVRVAPFPVAEAQARAVLHAFAHTGSLDPMAEAVDVVTRYQELKAQVGESPDAIAKAWHRFEAMQQFEYRDMLYDFVSAGEGILSPVWERRVGSEYGKVPDWEKEAYNNKDVLRKAWVMLEKSGEAEQWVKGVGEGGPYEWIDMMRKVVKWAQEQGIVVKETDKARL